MANQHEDRSEKPSLEEVLRVKQAERPDGVFWDRFDQELHQRMLQTLVKKDPWPVQLMRALSGRLAQGGAVAAVIAFLTVSFVNSPTFVGSPSQSDEGSNASSLMVMEALPKSISTATELAISFEKTSTPEFALADYEIDTVLAADVISSAGVRREFEMDSIQVSSYDTTVYTADLAVGAPSAFATAGVALVF